MSIRQYRDGDVGALIHEVVTLKFDQLISNQRIPKYLLQDARVDTHLDLMAENLIVALTRHIAYFEDEEGTLKVPATWWDHLKLRFFPDWARKRWPIRWTVYQARLYLPEVPRPRGTTFEYAVWRSEGEVALQPPAERVSCSL